MLGCGYQVNLQTTEHVSIVPLLAAYKAYFDDFGLCLYSNWNETYCYKFCNLWDNYFKFGESSYSEGGDLAEFFIKELPNCFYTDDYDFVSAHLDTLSVSSYFRGLDQIVDINPSKVDYSQYKEQVQKLIDMLWESLGTSGQAKFNNDKGTFAVSLGFDFTTKDEDVKKNSELIAKRLGTDAEDIQKKVEEMPASQVDAFVKINWNEVETNSWEDVVNAVQKEAKNINVPSVDTYSTLADGVSKFNEVLTQTSEIAADNTNVTQEYKDSITALGFSQEELNDVFDESNPLLVKNAALLRKLVLQKREEKRATVQAAKAQTQLQYRNTVKQLQQVVEAMGKDYKATGLVTDATKKSVDVLRSQLTALRQAQREYALLEIQLSGATSAYENFEKAKSMDEKLTYGDSMIEMLNTINDGFKTGQVGTEAFRVAVETLVPSSVYDDLDNFNDRMVAIHDYIDKNPLFADWFTIKDGEFSITQKNIQNFVDDAQKAGAFTSSDENGNFDLGEGVETIDDFVNKINDINA